MNFPGTVHLVHAIRFSLMYLFFFTIHKIVWMLFSFCQNYVKNMKYVRMLALK